MSTFSELKIKNKKKVRYFSKCINVPISPVGQTKHGDKHFIIHFTFFNAHLMSLGALIRSGQESSTSALLRRDQCSI